MSKKCPGCGDIKPLYEYHIDKSRPDGHRDLCKVCRNKSRRKKDPSFCNEEIARKLWANIKVRKGIERLARYRAYNRNNEVESLWYEDYKQTAWICAMQTDKSTESLQDVMKRAGTAIDTSYRRNLRTEHNEKRIRAILVDELTQSVPNLSLYSEGTQSVPNLSLYSEDEVKQ